MPVRTEAVMGTLVTMEVANLEAEAALDRSFGWFHHMEERCTRFNPHSELMRLTAQVGVAVPASDILYEAVRFAVAVAEESGGAFDPTVGHAMEVRGFNREHRTGEIVRSEILPLGAAVSYRDIQVNEERRTITLLRPLLLDLGAVVKGLAVDAAVRELAPFTDFLIDAGGDLYLGGSNPAGEPWSVGIRHPRDERACIDRLRVSNVAVCTSGDYERRSHILDSRTVHANSVPACACASVTVMAPTAMLADALATAAFVLGPSDGIPFLERLGVEGLIVTPELQCHETQGWNHAR
jgi:FAD:protein FMN transferase